jgi:transposase
MGRSPEADLASIYVAGEKLFVDYSGHAMEVIDGLTGEVLTTQIFVAVLGASYAQIRIMCGSLHRGA